MYDKSENTQSPQRVLNSCGTLSLIPLYLESLEMVWSVSLGVWSEMLEFLYHKGLTENGNSSLVCIHVDFVRVIITPNSFVTLDLNWCF